MNSMNGKNKETGIEKEPQEERERVKLPRLVIAATQSGAGKTTIVTGLIRALVKRGIITTAHKIGPDYIDPGYHELASGLPSQNLDSWLVNKERLFKNFLIQATRGDFAVIEGVMGLYDGGKNGISSTAEIAKLLSAPVVLVIDCKSMGESAAALALGFCKYDPRVNIVGVILNRLGSDTHREMIAEAMRKINLPVLGAVKRDSEIVMPERHLGLLPTAENKRAREDLIDRLGEIMSEQLDLDALIAAANSAPDFNIVYGRKKPAPKPSFFDKPRRVAVAKDEAFSFYYPDGLDRLQIWGAELIYFSTLADEPIPEADAVILGGGFPEMFAEKLAANDTTRQSLKKFAAAGKMIYAECGGYMYLMQRLIDFDGRAYPMTGILPGEVTMQKKLQTVGYVTAKLNCDCLLGKVGEEIRGHEFHFSRVQPLTEDWPYAFQIMRQRNGETYPAGYAANNILGSYLHINFAGL